jgi:hypothetical protein
VSYRVDTFGGRAFPDRPLSISLLVPSSSIDAICKPAGSSSAPAPAPALAQAGADTLGLVAGRVYYAEHAGRKAALILGYVERTRLPGSGAGGERDGDPDRSSGSSAIICTWCVCA